MMKHHRHRSVRGVSLLESMVTAVVLILGIGMVAGTVITVTKLNRRNLAQAQAYTIAEWWLERVTRIGCDAVADPDHPCSAIAALDHKEETVYWSASGAPTLQVPAAGDPEVRRPYRVSIDVDPPLEGNELGDPVLNRTEKGVTLRRAVNVRVTVGWQDEGSGDSFQAVALQTRVGP
ncbi:hypothetical protein JRI60_22345 [Archangium violaceum]|uniref:type IV pilus modification PilV family protein n=1 Tax=Archangium violaceum TaxID=83451 RepID=UPI0019520749|nr:hypothetical protein [Archangium violaceum]QRO01563.1 hypothetical protein JRI60_22345 [Archangium violaceum]